MHMGILVSIKELKKSDWILWSVSIIVVTCSYVFGGNGGVLSYTASMIGVTALIFVARGHVFGQFLTVLFSLLYGIISYQTRYYGEMATYLGMTLPIAIFSVVTWIKHPFERGKTEVEVNVIKKRERFFIILLTAAVTTVFYFILKFFDTPMLFVSTVSVTTSFLASYLTMRRSKYYAVAYAANDIVLIILWVAASFEHISYLSMVACFTMFFVNDIYGFICWTKMQKRQKLHRNESGI